MGAEVPLMPLATMFAIGFLAGLATAAVAGFLSDHIGEDDR
jgi:hypothetical protein